MSYSEEDKKAAWLILELAEQGRFEEIVAQMVASLISVGGGDPFEETLHIFGKIFQRISVLLEDDGAQVWQHLVPGGHQGDPLPWVVTDARKYPKVEVQILVLHDNGWIVVDRDRNLWEVEELSDASMPRPTKPGDIVEVLRQDLTAVDYSEIHHILN